MFGKSLLTFLIRNRTHSFKINFFKKNMILYSYLRYSFYLFEYVKDDPSYLAFTFFPNKAFILMLFLSDFEEKKFPVKSIS